MIRKAALLALLTASCGIPARAQFWDSLINPDVNVTITHPPSLGIKVERVAFAPVTNRMAEDLVSACIADLVASGNVEVVDRGNIEKVLGEQKLTNSGLIDEATAVRMGRLLGAPVLLFTQVIRADVKRIPLSKTTPGWTDKKGTYHPAETTWTSKTQVDYNASIQAVDLATGRIYAQKRIAVSPSREASSDKGQPEYPSDTSVIEDAVAQATASVHQMLLSWTEQRKLIFYDDKDYGMKEAYRRLQLKDTAGALAKSLEALEAARKDNAKPKYLGRTHYNVGMCRFIQGDYAGALPFLRAARETDPDHKIFAGAEAECLRAKALAEEMTRVDARSAKVEIDLPRAAESAAPAPAPKKAEGPSVEERLERLEALRKKGLVSPAEYKAKKAEIMKDL